LALILHWSDCALGGPVNGGTGLDWSLLVHAKAWELSVLGGILETTDVGSLELVSGQVREDGRTEDGTRLVLTPQLLVLLEGSPASLFLNAVVGLAKLLLVLLKGHAVS